METGEPTTKEQLLLAAALFSALATEALRVAERLPAEGCISPVCVGCGTLTEEPYRRLEEGGERYLCSDCSKERGWYETYEAASEEEVEP